MRKTGLCLTLAALLLCVLAPSGTAAQSLELGARFFYGMAAGTTNVSGRSGELDAASGAGLVLNAYLVDLGKVRLGLSTGLEAVNLNYIFYEPVTVEGNDTELKALARYHYAVIPVAVKTAIELNERLDLVIDLGANFGFFLWGLSHNTWDPELPFYDLIAKTETLDSENTPDMDIAARLLIGLDFEIADGLLLSPGLMFDWGFTDNTLDVQYIRSAYDTFWKLVGVVTLGFRLM